MNDGRVGWDVRVAQQPEAPRYTNERIRGPNGKIAGSRPRVAPGQALPRAKKCSKCRQIKPLEDFGKVPKNSDGRESRCKECHQAYTRGFRAAKRATKDELRWLEKLSLSKIKKRLPVLLRAVRAARKHGYWRGPEAMRAYRDLNAALELFQFNAEPLEDNTDPTFSESERREEFSELVQTAEDLFGTVPEDPYRFAPDCMDGIEEA